MKVLGLGWLQDVWSRREKTRFSCAQQVKRGCKQNSSPPAWWNFLRLSSRSGWLMCVCATGLPNFQISLYMMRSENASPLCSMQMIWPHRNTLQFYHMAFMCPKRLIIISLVNTTNSAQLLQAIFFFFYFLHTLWLFLLSSYILSAAQSKHNNVSSSQRPARCSSRVRPFPLETMFTYNRL